MAHDGTEATLRKVLDKVAVEQKYNNSEIEITPVSTEGANFTSFLFKATISSKKQDDVTEKDDLKLFAKVSAVGKKFREQTPIKTFEIERIFYTELAKSYRELEEKHEVPEEHRFKYPKIYAVDPTLYEETVVMENLSDKGYILHNRLESVTADYATAAFTELAKMHALSLALKHENPDEFNHYYEEYKSQFDFFETGGEAMKQMMEEAMKKTLEVANEQYKESLTAFLKKHTMTGGVEGFMKYYKPGERPVIRHGDFRPSNIMHRVKEDGTLDLVVVDYQTLIVGNPVIDLFYFIFLGTDQQFRDKHYEDLMEHYHRQLSEALARLGLRADDVYSYEQFRLDIIENLPYGLLISLTTLGLVTVDAADAPSLSGDTDLSTFMQMTSINSVYRSRINEIFHDYTRWGIL